MRNEIPDSWTYTSDLENLLFFFQNSEELLSYSSPDSFRLPVCNSMTLCYELRRIYGFLYRNKQIERYYSKYIPCIIDELIKTMQDDQILKSAGSEIGKYCFWINCSQRKAARASKMGRYN